MVAAAKEASKMDDLPKALELTFDPSTSTINLTLFEHTTLSSQPVPLNLQYEYAPQCGFAPSGFLLQEV